MREKGFINRPQDRSAFVANYLLIFRIRLRQVDRSLAAPINLSRLPPVGERLNDEVPVPR
jgi:hypothetical protein